MTIVFEECPRCGRNHRKLNVLQKCIERLIREDEELCMGRTSRYSEWLKPPVEAIPASAWLLDKSSVATVRSDIGEITIDPLSDQRVFLYGCRSDDISSRTETLAGDYKQYKASYWGKEFRREGDYWYGYSPELPDGWQEMDWQALRDNLMARVAGPRAAYLAELADVEQKVAKVNAENSAMLDAVRARWHGLTLVQPDFEMKFVEKELRMARWDARTTAECLPEFVVEGNAVTIEYMRTPYAHRQRWVMTEFQFNWSDDGHCVQVRGQIVGDNRYSMRQKFNFFIFKPGNGDSGIYVHRAPLSWWDMLPDDLIDSLRRWKTALQQGDVLFLSVTNGSAPSSDAFLHERKTIGSGKGSHKFSMPVSYHGEYVATETAVSVTHREHPTIELPAGVYKVGTTLPGLSLENEERDGKSVFFVPRGEDRQTAVWGQWRD